MSNATFAVNDNVFVFYRQSKRCTPQRKYVAVLDPRHGSWRPRVGISDGWIPAQVVGVDKGRVQVSYTWEHFATCRGHFADRDSDWTEWYSDAEVRAAAPGEAGKLNPPSLRPKLVLLTFRWGGYNAVVAPEQWGDTGSSVSDLFIDSFLDRAVKPALGYDFEVWTAYVEDHSDMQKIANAAHLIFGPNHPARRGEFVGGMYHLYPTSFEEGCIPSQETGSDGGAALVDQKSFFKMQQAVERAGIPTRFPHPSGFYELLSSKRWTYMMSLTPHLRVPPTVSLPRMLCENSIEEAAEKALKSLTVVKQQQAKLRGEPAPKEVTKGVAKLGFSWEALDVKFWEGIDGDRGLQNALFNLTQNIEISSELTGQPQDLEAIIVQEYMKHDLEVRLYVVDGTVEATIYTKFCKIKDNLEFGDFHEYFVQEEAANDWVGGDLKALQDGERQCREIVDHWMAWVQAQICELPPAIRFDFFVGRTETPGTAEVWTLEICELGFSMLGAKELPNKVLPAMLRSCLAPKSSSSSGSAPVAVPVQVDVTSREPVAACDKESQGASTAPAQSRPEASTSASTGPTATDNGETPQELFVHVPAGPDITKDQAMCTGRYELMKGMVANGAPVWIHDRGDRFLYHGNDDYWYVGDEEECDMNFECDQGYIRHHSSQKTMPHLLPGVWERGEEWDEDPAIVVNLDNKAPSASLRTSSSKGAKGGAHRRR